MLHAIYHIELDSFLHEGTELGLPDARELRFLYCIFTLDLGGPIVNIYDEDLYHLLHCHTPDRDSFSSDHQKLYDYLVGSGLEYIRFVPRTKDGVLDYGNSFTLNEWD